TVNYSFGNILNYPYSEDTFYQTWSLFEIGSAIYINNEFFYTPFIYNGTIYKYNLRNRSMNTYKGSKLHDRPFTRIVTPDIPEHAIHINGKVASAATIESEDIGLFQLKDGKIIHFSFQVIKDKRELFFEIFDDSMNLVK